MTIRYQGASATGALLGWVIAAASILGCSAKERASSSPAAGQGDEPLYVVASRVALPSGTSTIISALRSTGPGRVDIKDGLEVSGFGSAYGTPDVPNAVFVGTSEEPRITRYAVNADGTFAPQASINLGAFGLQRSPRTFTFVSPTKAYAISVETYQVLVWNPQAMTLDHEIDLSTLKREGLVPSAAFRAAVNEGKLLIPVTWARVGGDPGAAPESAIVSVDVSTDAIEVHEEPRCGGLRAIYAGGKGEFLFASSAGSSATWHRLYGERGGSEPCLVRFRKGETASDASFLLEPTKLVEGGVPVDFSPAGPSHLIFQALDETLAPVTPQTTAEELWAAPAWRFWSVPVDALSGAPDTKAVPVALPASALNALRFDVDGRNYVPQIKADYSETTLVDVTDPTKVGEGPTVAGSVGNFFRVR